MAGRKALSSAERSYYYNAIRSVDSQEEYVICDASTDTLSYTNKIKSNEAIHGRPTDEELTRALIVVNLINSLYNLYRNYNIV